LQAVEIAPGDHGPPHAGLRRAIHRRYAGRPFFWYPHPYRIRLTPPFRPGPAVVGGRAPGQQRR
jgi:hypothetical protein